MEGERLVVDILVAVYGNCGCTVNLELRAYFRTAGNSEVVILVTGVMHHQNPVGVCTREVMYGFHATRAVTAVLTGELLDDMFHREGSLYDRKRRLIRGVSGLILGFRGSVLGVTPHYCCHHQDGEQVDE